MVLGGKMLTNWLGFSEHNKRLEQRRLEQQGRRYDFPRPGPLRYLHPRGYGGPRRQQHGPSIPLRHPPNEVIRHVGHGALGIVPFQPDGLPIDYYGQLRPPRRPPYLHYHPHHHPYFYPNGRPPPRSSEFDTDVSDCSSCDEYLNGSRWDSSGSDMESLAETLEELSLRRRPSYERLRPVGFHNHSHNHPRGRHHPNQDHDDEYPHHHHHRHHQDHHHHQHGHPPHRGQHRGPYQHHPARDYDGLNGHRGGNRVPNIHDTDIHRTGGWIREDQSLQSDAHSDGDTAESW